MNRARVKRPQATKRKDPPAPSQLDNVTFAAKYALDEVRHSYRHSEYGVLFGLWFAVHAPIPVFSNTIPLEIHPERDALWEVRMRTLAELGELAAAELQRHAASPPVPLTAEEQEIRRQIEREVNTPERDDATRRGKFAALDELHAVVTALKRLRGAPAVDSRRLPILVELLPLAHLVSDVMMSEASAAPPHLFSVPRKTTTRPAASKR